MNRIQRENLKREYQSLLLNLEHHRHLIKTVTVEYQHLHIMAAMAYEMYMDEWCEEHGIEPQHTTGWYWS